MIKAEKTLAAIEAAMVADQGARYRTLLRELLPLAEDAYRGDEPPFRAHLGGSILGRDCAREIWYSFHWTTARNFEGSLLRLFNRGHLEEPRMLALLIMIGCEVWHQDENGRQFRIVGHNGHFKSAMDGVARGIPDIPPGQPALLEFKTYNAKNYARLVDKGMREAKWEHYVQMQTLMGAPGLPWGFYLATCKDTDDLHAEVIERDDLTFNRYQQRAAQVLALQAPPARVSGAKGADHFKCKLCDHSATCHAKKAPARNCRTCAYAAPSDNGTWLCECPLVTSGMGAATLTFEQQLSGCEHYELDTAFR